MTTGISFWDTQVWSFVLTLTVLLVAMMAANALTNVIPLIKRLMIPSSVLGGFLLLGANAVFKAVTGDAMYSSSTLEMLTYHGLGLGFVAMSLRRGEGGGRGEGMKGAFDSGVTVVCTYLLQAVLGLAITLGLSYLINSFAASGMLLPMGYGQGPGQAYNWGRTYENTYGFTDGTSFGLTVAAAGFIAASIGGIIYLNALRRSGRLHTAENGSSVQEDLTAQHITGTDEIPLSESMDKFTVQVALVFIAYAMAFLVMRGFNVLINSGLLGQFGYNTVQPLVWGFNFLFGTLCALLLKAVLTWLRRKNIVRREYTNNFMQTRIAGFMFDMMVVASIAAINLNAFKNTAFILPLTAVCVVGCAASYIYLRWLCPLIYPDYRDEAFLSLYGMLTGTASTGVILLREVDPQFTSQASRNLVYHQPWAIVFGFPMLLLLGVAPQSKGHAWLTLGICAALFIAMNLLLFRTSIFKCGKRRNDAVK